jgi:hypothetical protein
MTEKSRQITEAVTVTEGVLVTIEANEWYTFARMAIRQEHRAQAARNQGDAAADEYAPWLGLESDEAKLGLIAAHASLFHLRLVLKELLGVGNVNDIEPHHITTDVPEDPGKWKKAFMELADERGSMLHDKPEPSPAVRHPHYPTAVSPQTASPDLISLSSAVDLVLDALGRVLVSPTPAVDQWATKAGRSDAIARLNGFRRNKNLPM